MPLSGITCAAVIDASGPAALQPGARLTSPSRDAANVVPLRPPSRLGVPADRTSPVYQLTVVRKITREWGALLSDAEFRVLLFIIDHTVLWGRATYKFTYRCFMNGTGVSAGIAKGETQVRAALASLSEKGVIKIKRGQTGLDITPNPEWKPVAIRRRLQSGGAPSENRGSEPRKSEDQTLGNPNPYIEEQLEEQVRGTLRPAVADRRPGCSEEKLIPESKTISVPVPQVRIRTRPVRIENPTPAPTERPRLEISDQGEMNFGDAIRVAAGSSIPERYQPAAAKALARREMRHGGALFETWKIAFAETYSGVPGAGCVTWSKAEMAMVVTHLAKPFKGSSPELHDFVDWIVTNWAIVMVDEFRWMKRERPPVLPTLRFLLAFKDKFFVAYGRRSVDRYLDSLSDHERTIRKGLLRDGLTAQQADVRLVERRVRQQLREEMEMREAKAAQALRTAAAAHGNVAKERRELARQLYRAKHGIEQEPPKPVLPNGAREVSDEELAASVQLVAKMMEVDPNGE